MAHQYTFDQIEEYLDGTLGDEEKARFEEEIAADPELNDEVNEHRQARKLNELYTRQQLKTKVKNIQKQVKTEERSSGGFVVMRIAASLALLILAGGLYFYLQNSFSIDKVAGRAFEPYPNRFRTMGEEIGGNFMEGMEQYDTRNYQQAVQIFKNIQESDPQYVAAQFYMGISYLSLDETSQSIEVLQGIIDEGSELYSEAAIWYLSLAILEDGDEEKAKELLQTIAQKGGYKSDEAQNILKKLDSPVRALPGID